MVSQYPDAPDSHPAWDRGAAEASCLACEVAVGAYLLLAGGTEQRQLGQESSSGRLEFGCHSHRPLSLVPFRVCFRILKMECKRPQS